MPRSGEIAFSFIAEVRKQRGAAWCGMGEGAENGVGDGACPFSRNRIRHTVTACDPPYPHAPYRTAVWRIRPTIPACTIP